MHLYAKHDYNTNLTQRSNEALKFNSSCLILYSTVVVVLVLIFVFVVVVVVVVCIKEFIVRM